MDETIYILLEGGLILPISHVTANFTTSGAGTEVVVYDGSTYRDDPVDLLNVPVATSSDQNQHLRDTYTGSASVVALGLSDVVGHTAPRYHGKKRSLITITRSTNFSHIVWLDQIIGTSSHPPYRMGMTPPTIS